MEKNATQSATPKHKYRISNAAVGKILTGIIISAKNDEISHEQFHDLMLAAYSYIESENANTPTQVEQEKWDEAKSKIDRAAKRSKAARERAAKRRSITSPQSTTYSVTTDAIISTPILSPGPCKYKETDFYRTDEVGERFFKKYGVRLYRRPDF